jgi:hypothetical protein
MLNLLTKFCVLWGAVVIATFLVLAKPANAQGLYIEGGVDCASWLQARAQPSSGMAFESYVLGTLNGLTMGVGLDFWRADGNLITRQQAYLWVDNYCRANPLSNVLSATLALFKERTGTARWEKIR